MEGGAVQLIGKENNEIIKKYPIDNIQIKKPSLDDIQIKKSPLHDIQIEHISG